MSCQNNSNKASRAGLQAGIPRLANKAAFVATTAAATAVAAAVYGKTKLGEAATNHQVMAALGHIRRASTIAQDARLVSADAAKKTAFAASRRDIGEAIKAIESIPGRTKQIEALKGELNDMVATVLSGHDLQEQADLATNPTSKIALSAHAFSAFSSGRHAAAWSFLARPSQAGKNAALAGAATAGISAGALLLIHLKKKRAGKEQAPPKSGRGQTADGPGEKQRRQKITEKDR